MLLWIWSPESRLRKILGRHHKPLPVKPDDDPGGFLVPRNRILLGWLYREFRPQLFYMSALHLVHRFFFAAVVSIVINTAFQLLLSVVLTLIFAISFLVTKPYYNDRLNVLQAVMYASVLIQLGLGTCFYSGSLFSEVWRSRFQFASFMMIVGAGLVFLWTIIMDVCDFSAFNKAERVILNYLRHRHNDYITENGNYERSEEQFELKEEAVKELIEMFNPVKLWSWVEKVHPRRKKGFWGSVWQDVIWIFVRAWKKVRLLSTNVSKTCCLPAPKMAPQKTKFEKKMEMELFVEVAYRLKETGCFDKHTCYQSLMDEAELWSFFVKKFPEGLSYLFNVEGDGAANLDDFFKHFYLYYWRSKKFIEKPKSKPTLKRQKAMNMNASTRWNWLTGEFLVAYDVIMKEERLVEPDHLHATLFDCRSKREVPGITWLILSKSRAQLAWWLSKNTKYPIAKGLFESLVFDINRASTRFSDGCWEEKFMRISSLNLMSIFRPIVPPKEINRKLIDDERPSTDEFNDSRKRF